MANAMCNEGYCDSTSNREVSLEMTVGNKISIIGGGILAVVALTALLWYEVTLGIYINSAFLS